MQTYGCSACGKRGTFALGILLFRSIAAAVVSADPNAPASEVLMLQLGSRLVHKQASTPINHTSSSGHVGVAWVATPIASTINVTSVSTASTASTTSAPIAVQAGDTIWLRVHTGKYLTVQNTTIHARWGDRRSWQAFVIEKESWDGYALPGLAGAIAKDVNIHSGDSIYLRAHTGRRVSVQNTTVHAQWDNKGSWERFVIEKNGSFGLIYPNDTIYLRAHTGKRVSVHNTTVVAQWENQLVWEALRIESDGPTDSVEFETSHTGADNGTSWQQFEGYNCYPFRGGEDILGKSPLDIVLRLQDCRLACVAEPTCDGVVMKRNSTRDQCWLRRNVETNGCDRGTPYDLWMLHRENLVQ